MSRKSYLGRLASRAAPNPPGFVPPRRLVGAPSVMSVEGKTLPTRRALVTVAAPLAAHTPVVTPEPTTLPVNAPSPPAESRQIPVARNPLDDSGFVTAADQGRVLAPAPNPTPAESPKAARPPADFVFDTPRQLVPPPRPSLDEVAHVERVAAAPPAVRTDTEPIAPARQASIEWAPTAPDPVATALVAAVRWTSSEPTPPPARTAEPAMSASPSRDERLPTVVRRPNFEGRPDAARQTPTTPSPTSEPFTDVHIGSIEVEIVSPPELRQPETPVAAPQTRRADVVPLTRKVTSYYGLHQR